MIEGEELCDKIWNRVSNLMKKGFDSESVYNDKYLKIKTKSHDGNINTNLHGNGVPKEGPHCVCLFGNNRFYFTMIIFQKRHGFP